MFDLDDLEMALVGRDTAPVEETNEEGTLMASPRFSTCANQG